VIEDAMRHAVVAWFNAEFQRLEDSWLLRVSPRPGGLEDEAARELKPSVLTAEEIGAESGRNGRNGRDDFVRKPSVLTAEEIDAAWQLGTWDAIGEGLRPLLPGHAVLREWIECEYHTAAKACQRNPAGPRVRLGATWEDPVEVLGKRKWVGNYAAFKVVKALVEAGDAGLSKAELEQVTPGALKVLRRLREDDDWRAVVQMAQRKGNRYRLRRQVGQDGTP
jgi:hypothetical protein